MDLVFEDEWKATLNKVEEKFGGGLDIQAVLFLIGVQELGHGPRKFTKDEKLEVLHIAICRILSTFGYYKLNGRDEEGWPHYDVVKDLPSLKSGEQLRLMKEGIIQYFKDEQTF